MLTSWSKDFLIFGATLFLVGVPVKAMVEVTLSPGCREFLYMGTAPLGLEDSSLVMICQCYRNKPRYVTLYNIKDHIPVYSAYTFKRSDGEVKVDVPWMYEPQLFTTSDTGEMQQVSHGHTHQNFEDVQAVLEDYTNAVLYERAQLNPDEHQAHPDDKAATYTLTNVVPQVREFHRGPWKRQEQIIRQRLNNYCHGTAYVITGIISSGNMIHRNNIARLAIPSFLWSAYCCTDYDHNTLYDEGYKFPAFAYYAPNDKENNQVMEVPVSKLEEFLKASGFVNKNFKIFLNDCMSV